MNHAWYSYFQYLCFHQAIINDQDFSVAIAFCLVSSPLTVSAICFSLTGLVSVHKKTLCNNIRKLAADSNNNGTKWSVKFTKTPRHSVRKKKQTNRERLNTVVCLFYIKYNLTNAY